MLWKLAAILGISLGVSFLCSILEAVFLSVTHGYVHVLRERGSRAGRLLHRLQSRVSEPITAILTLNTIANTFGAALGGALALQLFGEAWMALFSAALTLAILLFSEILPKTLGATLWPHLAPAAAYTLRFLILLTKPIILPLQWYTRLIAPTESRPSTVSRAELEALATIGHREGSLDEEEWRLVSSVMGLSEVTVGEVMTPRTDIVAVEVSASVEEAVKAMLSSGHLRLPVYEGSLDRIVGILTARDLWSAHREGREKVSEVMRPPFFAPLTKPVHDLLLQMRRKRLKMALVLDEFGGIAGLVTLEDLLEEIVGEIQDEHEGNEPEDFEVLDSGAVRIWAGVNLRDAEEILSLPLPGGDYDTLAGFVAARLNRMPRVGDTVELPEGTLTVQHMRGRRIDYILFSPSPRPDPQV